METTPSHRIADGFADILYEANFAFLEGSPDPSFALDSSMCLAYVNPAYLTFGCANGGINSADTFTGIGIFVGNFMNEPLRQFYLNAYTMVMENNKTWSHDYDCSSPSLYRRFRQSAYPLPQKGIVVINHLIEERTHTASSGQPVKAIYLNKNGLIAQCSHCRKVRQSESNMQWDWVSEWVANPPSEITHSLCEFCADYYYKGLQLTLNTV